jgi:hypothetical protein
MNLFNRIIHFLLINPEKINHTNPNLEKKDAGMDLIKYLSLSETFCVSVP